MGELATLDLPGGVVVLRTAVPEDLPELVRLLASDELAVDRESTGPAALARYRTAFDAISADSAHLLVVSVVERRPVGTLQLSVLPGLARRGAWRAQIESVRVDGAFRGRGIGAAMVEWAVAEAQRRGCALVQLTTDKRRPDAHRFYRRLGFEASHEGMKIRLVE